MRYTTGYKRNAVATQTVTLIGLAFLFAVLTAHAEDEAPPAFWDYWGDGRAEVASYDLTFPRYGEKREGVAVTVFVTETFSDTLKVKADPGRHPKWDEFPVMKLNLIQDFPTGIYDYNVMTSAFVGLAPHDGREKGRPAKVSFSSQEWCGHVWAQLLFDSGTAKLVSHSYFDGEADLLQRLPVDKGGYSEDALLLWARGFAAPELKPGESKTVPMLRSLETARLRHTPVMPDVARLTRGKETRTITVPGGTFEVEVFTAVIATREERLDDEKITDPRKRRAWTFFVEKTHPRRLIRWENAEGLAAEYVKGERLKYWEMNGPKGIGNLEKIGLKPRGKRMP